MGVINLTNITNDPIHLPAGNRISVSLFDLNIVDLSDNSKRIYLIIKKNY